MNGPWFDAFHQKHPDIPIGCSEYGCEGLNWHSPNPKQGDYTEEYQAYYHEELIKQLFSRKYLWATYVWNMFDFGADGRAEGGEHGQNHKGLVTFDRAYKKDAFYAYKSWLSDEPFVHLCGKRYIDRVEDVTKITVYSNQPEVELYVDGMLFEKQSTPNHFFHFRIPNVGESVIMAKAGKLQDSGLIRKVDAPNPDYILKETGTVLNWFDIQEPNGKFSLNDTIEDIAKNEQGKAWMNKFEKLLKAKMTEGSSKQDGKAPSVGDVMNPQDMMKMIGGFTVLRLTSMMGMMNVSFSKEELLSLNKQLNQISKDPQ